MPRGSRRQRTPTPEVISPPTSPITLEKPLPSVAAYSSRLPADVDWTVVRKQARRLTGAAGIHGWQWKTASRALAGRSQVVLAGTGSGKSMIYVLMLLAARQAAQRAGKTDAGMFILVGVTKALQDDQAATLAAYGFDARVLNDQSPRSAHAAFLAGEGDLWTMSPEMLLRNQAVRTSFIDPSFRARVNACILDEAHTVHDWGGSFRPDILKISHVQEAMGSSIPWILLSATMTTAHVLLAIDVLNLRGRAIDGVDVGPNRDEGFYEVRPLTQTTKAKQHLLNDLAFLLPKHLFPPPTPSSPFSAEAHAASPNDLPSSVIFLKEKQDCRDAVAHYRKLLPPHLRRYVESFTGDQSAGHRSRLLERFRRGNIKILFATEAFGVGCDIPGLKYGIQFGDPMCLGQLDQRVGRAGRGMVAGADTRFIWFANPLDFGPLPSPTSSPTLPPPPPHPITRQVPANTQAAFSRRTALHSNDPHLYSLLNPPSIPGLIDTIASSSKSTASNHHPRPASASTSSASTSAPPSSSLSHLHLSSPLPSTSRLSSAPYQLECRRVLAERVFRPELAKFIRYELGGTWRKKEYSGSSIAPGRCCSACWATRRAELLSRKRSGEEEAELEAWRRQEQHEQRAVQRAGQFLFPTPEEKAPPINAQAQDSLRVRLESARAAEFHSSPLYPSLCSIYSDRLISNMVKEGGHFIHDAEPSGIPLDRLQYLVEGIATVEAWELALDVLKEWVVEQQGKPAEPQKSRQRRPLAAVAGKENEVPLKPGKAKRSRVSVGEGPPRKTMKSRSGRKIGALDLRC